MELWKVRPFVKGALTWVPGLYEWKLRRSSTGGSDSSRYCYSVWLRHLVALHALGFRVRGARIGELGPGDSLGVGIAALLSGADTYLGLDVVPFSDKADHGAMLDELIQLYRRSEPIPGDSEFPRVLPRLDDYGFPDEAIDLDGFDGRVSGVRAELARGVGDRRRIAYESSWMAGRSPARETLDLILSQAVMEHVEEPEKVYRAMWDWLRPGGYGSHVIGLDSHRLSPVWNGHWAYSDWEWRIVRGKRRFLINRQPLGLHVRQAALAGFEIVSVVRMLDDSGLDAARLADRFRDVDGDDLRTSGAMLILRKPATHG